MCIRFAECLLCADLVQWPSWGVVLSGVGTGATAGAGDLGVTLEGLGIADRVLAEAERTRQGGYVLGEFFTIFIFALAELSTISGEGEDILGSSFRCLWVTSGRVPGIIGCRESMRTEEY